MEGILSSFASFRVRMHQVWELSFLRHVGALLLVLACCGSSPASNGGLGRKARHTLRAGQATARQQSSSEAQGWMEITPTTAVIVVGYPQPLSAWNDSGQQLSNATWSLSNPELGSIVVEEYGGVGHEPGAPQPQKVVHFLGKAPGRVTVTAKSKNAEAHAAIEVVSGPYLKSGSNRWTVSAHPGYSTIDFLQGSPADSCPDLYSIENGGQRGLWVRALDSLGMQHWAYHWAGAIGEASVQGAPPPVPALLKPGKLAFVRAVPDTEGGAILQFEDAASRSLLVRLDGRTGNESWRYASPGWLYRTSTEGYDAPLYIVEVVPSPQPEAALLGIDVRTGAVKYRLPFPPSQSGERNAGCRRGNDHIAFKPSEAGAPMTSAAGSVILEVLVSSDVRDALPCASGGTVSIVNSLRLLKVKEDGTTDWQTIREFTYRGSPDSREAEAVPSAEPSEVIPDGQGGFQAAWTYSVDFPRREIEARITRITRKERKEFSLPLPGWGGTPWEPSDSNMVLGEETTGMAKVGSTVVAYDVVTGQVKWVWRAALGGVRILTSLAGNGLLITNRGEVVMLDASGKLSPEAQKDLMNRWSRPMPAEDAGNDQIDANGMTAFNVYTSQTILAIQTPRPPARPSALVAVAIGDRSD
jgi:hypothetical protein